MKILIIAEHKNGALSEAAMELFGLPFGQAEVHAVAAGEGVEPLVGPLGQLGVAKLHLINSPALASYTGESFGQALGQFIQQLAPDVVLAAHTPQGRDLAPRLAAALAAALATDCIQVSLDGGQVTARRPVYAGKATAEVEFNGDSLKVITVRPRTVKAPEPDASRSVEVTEVAVELPGQKTALKEIIASDNVRPDVTEAAIIVTGGRSLGSAENFSIIENFADSIGGRPVARGGRCRVPAVSRPGRPDREGGVAGGLHCVWCQRRNPALGRHAYFEAHRCHQYRPRSADFPVGRLLHRR